MKSKASIRSRSKGPQKANPQNVCRGEQPKLKEEAAVRISEIRYRRHFEAARDGILILDPITRKITDANPFMSELLGYSHDELLGKELWDIGLLKDEKESRSAFRELQKKHFIRYEDLPLQNKAGQRREVEFVSNLYNEGGRKVIQCNIRDITERKQAEAALRASEERFRHMVEGVQDYAIFMVNRDGCVTTWNNGAERLKGYSSQEILGRHFSLFYEPHDVELGNPERALKVAAATGWFEDEGWRVRKDGSRFWANVVITALKDEADKLQGFVKVTRDMSERKEAEESLRESEERFHAIFSQATVGIAQADLDGRFTLVNKCYCDITGRTAKELLDLRMQDITHPDDRAINAALLKELKEEGHCFLIETRYVRPNGEIVWVRNSVSRVTHSTADGKYFLAVTQDITESRRAQQALLAAKNEIVRHALELEQVVAERTAELRETIGELEGFSYSVSHDMRAPLRAMQSFAQFLVEEYGGKLDNQGVHYLQQIMRSAVRLDRLIQDVLSYSRILHMKLPMEPVDLDCLVRDVLETFPTEQPIKPEIQIKGTLPKVIGNEALLAQCVSNLLSNAVKFVSPGTTPRVEVSAEAIGEDSIRVWFKDNGIGIAAKNCDRIFRLFERIHPATDYAGTGIGLTIVRKAAERIGAQVGLESELGRGSKFWIELKKG